MMYEKPKNPKTAADNANGSANDTREPRANVDVGDFELWLESELVKLEARYESFSTTNSNRAFFNRDAR